MPSCVEIMYSLNAADIVTTCLRWLSRRTGGRFFCLASYTARATAVWNAIWDILATGPRVCSLASNMEVGGFTITDFPTIPLQLLYLWCVFDVVFGIVI